MQIVIDIPEDVYKDIQSLDWKNTGRLFSEEWKAIHNGTPLPKGHGRLIDADVLVDGMENDYEFCEAVNATPTIIEADGGDAE